MKTVTALLFLVAHFTGSGSSIQISEIATAGTATVSDKKGNHPDWIEIENTTATPLSLSGYCLSDDIDDLQKFRFKSTEIAANGFVVVQANTKVIPSNTDLHADFNLNSKKETVYLSDSTGTIIDSTTTPALSFNQSTGRNTDKWVVFDNPTPNQENLSGNVLISHQSGFYPSPIIVTLSTDENRVIRYTLDGSEPTATSAIYTEPLSITSGRDATLSNIPTTVMTSTEKWNWEPFYWKPPNQMPPTAATIKCSAFSHETPVSRTYSRTFFIGQEFGDMQEFPVVAVTMDADDLFSDDKGIYIPGNNFSVDKWKSFWPPGNYDLDLEKKAHFEYFDTEGNLQMQEPALMKITGKSSLTFAQKSFKLSFSKDDGAENITYPVFGLSSQEEYNELGFRNSGNDFLWTHFADAFMHSLLTETGLETSASAPCHIFINGEYWGIFNIRERYSKQYFNNLFGVDEQDLTVLANNTKIIYGSSSKEYRDILMYAIENNPEDASFYNHFDSVIDIANFIDYNICQIYFANFDWPGNNYKAWKTKEPGSKWRYLLFDLDYSMGLMNNALVTKNSLDRLINIDTTDNQAEEKEIRTIRMLLRNPQFQAEFTNRFNQLLRTTFDPDRVISILDQFEQRYENQMPFQIDRWGFPADMDAWYSNIDKIRNFARYRPCELKGFLDDAFGTGTADYSCKYNEIQTEAVSASVLVYPNPASTTISIECGQDIQTISVQSMAGIPARCNTEKTPTGYTINVANLPSGLYCIMATFDGQYFTKTIAITH